MSSLFFIKLFDIYINIIEFVRNTPILMYLLCNMIDTKQKLHNFVYRIREEPIEKTWICTCYMNRIGNYTDNNYNYNEIYGKIDHSKYNQNRGNKEMICDNRHIPVFIFKYDDNYMCRLLFDKDNIKEHYTYDDDSSMWVNIDTNDSDDSDTNDSDTNDNDNDTNDNGDINDSDTNDNDTDNGDINDSDGNDINDDSDDTSYYTRKGIDLISLINFIPSNVRFYSIEYTNPMMETSIQLQLPQKFYMVGTQLLSAVFIARLLEYTIGENNIFNMDYKLNIMDDNIQSFSLLSDQYIELYEGEYKIKNIYEA